MNNLLKTIVHPINGDRVTFLKTSEETGWEYTLIELEVLPFAQGNSKAPLHYHLSYTETFAVKEGQLTVYLHGRKHTLNPGDSATAGIKALHAFSNETGDTVLATVELRPGSTGFQKSLCCLYGLAKDGKSNKDGLPKSIANTALLMLMADVRMTGIFKIIFQLWKSLLTSPESEGLKMNWLKGTAILLFGKSSNEWQWAARTYNRVLPKACLNGFDSTFVQGSTFVLRMIFCAKNPRLRQCQKRYAQAERTKRQGKMKI